MLLGLLRNYFPVLSQSRVINVAGTSIDEHTIDEVLYFLYMMTYTLRNQWIRPNDDNYKLSSERLAFSKWCNEISSYLSRGLRISKSSACVLSMCCPIFVLSSSFDTFSQDFPIGFWRLVLQELNLPLQLEHSLNFFASFLIAEWGNGDI